MKVAQWVKENLVNRFRQFGFRSICSQIAGAIVRPVCQIKRYLILAVINHQPEFQIVQPEIFEMTADDVSAAFERGDLDEQQRALLLRFLSDGCRGFFPMIEDHLAGYAFIQQKGPYVYGAKGRFQIPKNMIVLKNLLIFPVYRGLSLGKYLNQARLSSIPANQTPIVFVITENRFAIRNLKMYGFKEMLIVTRTIWLKRWINQRIHILNDCDIARQLVYGLKCTEIDN